MIKRRLIDVALIEFAAKGVDGVSTRAIAMAAGTAMSSITYHYGSKEGLYIAVARHVATLMQEQLRPPSHSDLFAYRQTPAAAREGIHQLISFLTDKLAEEPSHDWTLFMVREQLFPSTAFGYLYEGAIKSLVKTLVDLICIASESKDLRMVKILSITLLGQVFVIRGSRATCLRLLSEPAFTADDLRDLKARLYANVEAIIEQMSVRI